MNAETETAIAQVDAAASEEWKQAALDAVYQVCRTHQQFFVQDVWDQFKSTDGDYATQGTRDMRALGPVMRKARAMGWCEGTKEYRRVPYCHHHLRPVWRSCVFGPAVQ